MNGWSLAAVLLHAGCGVLYALLGLLILVRRRPSRTGLILAGACLVTAGWGAAVAVASMQRYGIAAGVFDLLRPAAWFGFVLHLYRRTISGPGRDGGRWVAIGLALVLAATLLILQGQGQTNGAVALWSVWVVGRLGLAVSTLLLIENLYLNTPADLRWHINLPCIGLAALAIYDVALSGKRAAVSPAFARSV